MSNLLKADLFRADLLKANLLKANYTQIDEEARIIDYNELIKEKLKALRVTLASDQDSGTDGEFVAGIQAEVVQELVNTTDELEEARMEAEQIRAEAGGLVKSAKEEAGRILDKAKEQAKKLKEQAKKEGKELGYEEGLKDAKRELARMEEDFNRRMAFSLLPNCERLSVFSIAISLVSPVSSSLYL